MRPLHAFRKTLAILGVALATAVGLSLLPENDYQRWKLLDGTIHARARWMYERVHFDPQQLDVVFVGPSRIGAGVDAPRLGAALAARGLPGNVVNFSLPETGRNVNYVIVDELLKTKQPKLIVIGVTEKPSRYGHSTFKFLAPRQQVATAGLYPPRHPCGWSRQVEATTRLAFRRRQPARARPPRASRAKVEGSGTAAAGENWVSTRI